MTLDRDVRFFDSGEDYYGQDDGEVSWRGNAMKIRTDGANKLNDTAPALSAASTKISD